MSATSFPVPALETLRRAITTSTRFPGPTGQVQVLLDGFDSFGDGVHVEKLRHEHMGFDDSFTVFFVHGSNGRTIYLYFVGLHHGQPLMGTGPAPEVIQTDMYTFLF